MTISTGRTGTETVHRTYASGVVLVVLGAIAFSSAGFFVRQIGRDAASILFWRGLFTALAILLYLLWRDGRTTLGELRRIGGVGYAVIALQTASMAFFITSLQYTTVANNSIIFGTGPFIVAGLAWLLIGERPSPPTLLFCAVALMGAGIAVGGSMQLSTALMIGDALALAMTLAFAMKTVLLRKHSGLPMVHAACLGALLGSAGASLFVPDWSISARELALFALFGFTQQGAGLVLTTLGIARVPAAHAALLMTLDLPMSPVWVWLAFGEKPGFLSLVGGAVVLVAIIGHILVEGRRRLAAAA